MTSTIEEAMVSRMTGYSELAALVGARVYPNVVPQNAELPAIAYQKIGGLRLYAHGGPSGYISSRVQFTIEAETVEQAARVATALRHCWSGYSGTVSGVKIHSAFCDDDLDGYSESQLAPVKRLDVIINHDES